MYDKKLLHKLVTKYERKAGVSLMLYQETGNEKTREWGWNHHGRSKIYKRS